MIVDLCAVIDNRHYVRIVVLIVIIERIEKDSQAGPKIRATENGAVVEPFLTRVPECQTIRPYPSTSTYSEY